jgi:hypothetical protein
MSKNRHWGLLFLVLLTALNVRAQSPSKGNAKPQQLFGNIPHYFEENRGQTDAGARYIARGGNQVAFVTQNGLVLSSQGEAIAMRIVDASRNARITAEGEVEGVSNYYLGKRSISGLAHYSRVRVNDIRPGIDVLYHWNEQSLEYDVVIHPGANPEALLFRFEGGSAPEVADNGDLVFKTNSGELRQHAPQVWQEAGGRRRAIGCKYVLSGLREVKLQLSGFDRSLELVIDPVLSYSTYLIGASNDVPAGIAADSVGSAYVTGQTCSDDFPVTTGSFNGDCDIFVTKLNAGGTALIYSTYIGGSSSDSGNAIAIDADGNAYLTGSTTSTDFPFTSGHYSGSTDAFALKVDPSGSLLYATALGGSYIDNGAAIAVDTTGAAYVTGTTYSTDFPVTTGALITVHGNSFNTGFVVKVTPAGQISYATYLGGTNSDSANAIAVDSSGNTYIEGTSWSTDFPASANAISQALDGEQDAFVAKLNPTGSALVYATYLGGSAIESPGGIAIDTAGDCFVTGVTTSTDFPTTPGAYLTAISPGQQAWFVSKLNPTGTALIYSTLLLGSNWSPVTPIAVDSAGSAYISGSSYGTFSTTPGALRAVRPSEVVESDLFLVKLSNDGTTLDYSTMLGTVQTITVSSGLALDGNGSVYITASTNSVTFPTSDGAFQPLSPKAFISGLLSGIVAKIDLTSPTLCSPVVAPTSQSVPWRGGPISFSLTLAPGCPWEAIPGVGNSILNEAGNNITLDGLGYGIVKTSPIVVTGTVGPNNNTAAGETGSVVIGSATFTVNQAAGSCGDPVASPTAVIYASAGGAQNLDFVLPTYCNWTAVSTAPWVTIASNASGIGPGTISIFAGQNGFSQRNASLIINGVPISVTQSGLGCTATASGSPLSFSAQASTGFASITTNSGDCNWSAYSTVPWIQVPAQSSSGQGSGQASFLVSSNPGSLPRTGQILIGDQTRTINQSAGPVGQISSYTASIYAGGGDNTLNLGDGGLAINAVLNMPQGVAFDQVTGNLYVVDSGSARIRVITPDGNINTFAGGGSSTGENVPALSAQLVSPQRVAVDSSSSVYFDDSWNRVRKVSNGSVATFAGSTSSGFSGDGGSATSALMSGVLGIAADSQGNVYIADGVNNRIRKVTGGKIKTFAGGGDAGLGDGGPATSATLSSPMGVAVDSAKNVYIADVNNSRIREVSQGTIRTFADVTSPTDVAVDPSGNLFIPGSGYSILAMVTPGGVVSSVPVTNPVGYFSPTAVTTDALGDVYFSNYSAGLVHKLTPDPSFCSYPLMPPTNVPAAGGSLSITVTATVGCNWNAESGLSWLTISSGASGTGKGTVHLRAASNLAGPSRTGTIVVAGQVISVTQAGRSGPATMSSPSVTQLSPKNGSAGRAAFTLKVTGKHFEPSSVVLWGGSDRPTTYVSSTVLRAAITADDIATASVIDVSVMTPAPGGGTSGTVSFAVRNPRPVLTSFSPASVIAGSGDFVLILDGSGFVNGSIVEWNGSNRDTTFISSTQLSVAITSADVATAGTALVKVNSPTPGGGTSITKKFTIDNPIPVATSLLPESIDADIPAFTLTVTGSNFVNGSTIVWKATKLSTTFVNSTQLTALVSASDVLAVGTDSIAVVNRSPGGGTSNKLPFTVNNPTPTLTSLSPSSATTGGASFTLKVKGSHFVNGASVLWNGATLVTTFVSSTQLRVEIAASDISSSGTVQVSISNPEPGGGTSGMLEFSIE